MFAAVAVARHVGGAIHHALLATRGTAAPRDAPPPSQVFAAVVRHVDWDIVRCLVIAGPGFAKDQFREFLDKGGWVWLAMCGLVLA